MSHKNRKYWMGVASKEHVENGLKLGICQFCHGKKGPANRPSKGDIIIYYSSKMKMGFPEPCQEFTALGKIEDQEAYQVSLENGFKPFRRKVSYLKAKVTPIKSLIEQLPFIKNKKSWGFVFRFGFFEIDEHSYQIIKERMMPMRKENE